jgi:hypothetical protein
MPEPGEARVRGIEIRQTRSRLGCGGLSGVQARLDVLATRELASLVLG